MTTKLTLGFTWLPGPLPGRASKSSSLIRYPQTICQYPSSQVFMSTPDSSDQPNHAPFVWKKKSESSASEQTDTCTIVYGDKKIRVKKGTVLRTALIENGYSPHNGGSKVINCRGLGTCGTCALTVQAGNLQPPQRSARENIRLYNVPPHNKQNTVKRSLRLACQVRVDSDFLIITKNKGFWGHLPKMTDDQRAEN